MVQQISRQVFRFPPLFPTVSDIPHTCNVFVMIYDRMIFISLCQYFLESLNWIQMERNLLAKTETVEFTERIGIRRLIINRRNDKIFQSSYLETRNSWDVAMVTNILPVYIHTVNYFVWKIGK